MNRHFKKIRGIGIGIGDRDVGIDRDNGVTIKEEPDNKELVTIEEESKNNKKMNKLKKALENMEIKPKKYIKVRIT